MIAIPKSRNLLLLTVLFLFTLSALEAARVTTVRGEVPGLHIVLIVPEETFPQTIGLARQLATLPLTAGQLTLVETNSPPEAAEAPAFVQREASLSARPDWIWIHRGAQNGVDVPTLRLLSAQPGDLQRIASAAIDREVSVEHSTKDDNLAVQRGIMALSYPGNTPYSRQQRFTREIAVGIFRHAGMLPQEAAFDWAALRQYSPRLIALYDAEGIGGGGPANLERIAATRIDGIGIFRVAGEDIHDGALAPTISSIFPGGSGRGIGDGLQDQGREILRDYITAGGGYLGVCAGAYFAASGLENYLGAINLRHSQPWMRGRDTVKIELTEAGRKLFGGTETVLTTRFANGPVFLPEDQSPEGDPDFIVLATFKTPSTDRSGVVREEMVGQAAIGARTFGEGRILTISPHPESHEEHFDFVARAIAWTMGED